jgi:hypothetical protein
MLPLYLNLGYPVTTRMRELRQRGDWREARSAGFHNAEGYFGSSLCQGFNDKTPIWSTFAKQFRDERDAHDIARIDHTGWFCDPDGNNLCIGIVARLPHGRFITGYRLSDSGERVYFDDIYIDETEAAQMADEEARIYGELENEYQTLWQEARKLEDDIADRIEALRELRDMHSATILAYSVSTNATVCLKRKNQASKIRNGASDIIELIRESRKELADSRFDAVREG